jgi:hypothetical protein
MARRQQYSLFGKKNRSDRQWTRLHNWAMPKDQAVRFYQDALLAPFTGSLTGEHAEYTVRELRPVKRSLP